MCSTLFYVFLCSLCHFLVFYLFLEPCVLKTNDYRTKFEAWNPQSGYKKYQSGRKSLTEYPNSPAAICKALDIMHQKVGEALFQKSRKTSIKLYINKLLRPICANVHLPRLQRLRLQTSNYYEQIIHCRAESVTM